MSNPVSKFLELFHSISEDESNLLINAFEERNYDEGDYLFESQHICKEMFFISEGVLRILVSNKKGNKITHFFLKENQFCTILNSFKNQLIAEESIQAACNVTVFAISYKNLLALYEKLPYLKGLIDLITQQALIDKINIRNSYLGLDSTERYKLFMIRQAEIALRIPLSDVASYLGITQQSLSRIRKKNL